MDSKKYINDVMKNIHVNRRLKKRIKEDLEQRINEAQMDNPYFNPTVDLGEPVQYAMEFMENLQESGTFDNFTNSNYEYKSERTLFGLPLVHINTGGNSRITKTAKGIVAIGDISIGFISLGGVSIGVISLGGVSLGLLTLGGVSIGLAAFGAVSIGLFSMGAVSIGILKALGVVGPGL